MWVASDKTLVPLAGFGFDALSSANSPSRGNAVRTTEADSATGRSLESSSGIFSGAGKSSRPGLGDAMMGGGVCVELKLWVREAPRTKGQVSGQSTMRMITGDWGLWLCGVGLGSPLDLQVSS